MEQPKVLIIDDEEELVEALVERMEFRGIPVEGALNGREGLQRLAAGGFDVVVLDLMIPGISGVEVLRTIKERHPGVQVLLITGHGTDPGGETEMPEGARSILLKPFSIQDLIRKIQDIRACDHPPPPDPGSSQ
jgi:DNA-binding NtrC family response regulator